jgi:hypothetical protein
MNSTEMNQPASKELEMIPEDGFPKLEAEFIGT